MGPTEYKYAVVIYLVFVIGDSFTILLEKAQTYLYSKWSEYLAGPKKLTQKKREPVLDVEPKTPQPETTELVNLYMRPKRM